MALPFRHAVVVKQSEQGDSCMVTAGGTFVFNSCRTFPTFHKHNFLLYVLRSPFTFVQRRCSTPWWVSIGACSRLGYEQVWCIQSNILWTFKPLPNVQRAFTGTVGIFWWDVFELSSLSPISVPNCKVTVHHKRHPIFIITFHRTWCAILEKTFHNKWQSILVRGETSKDFSYGVLIHLTELIYWLIE